MTSSDIRKSERTIPGLVYMVLKTVLPYMVWDNNYGQIRMVCFFQKKKQTNLKISSKKSIRQPSLKTSCYLNVFQVGWRMKIQVVEINWDERKVWWPDGIKQDLNHMAEKIIQLKALQTLDSNYLIRNFELIKQN